MRDLSTRRFGAFFHRGDRPARHARLVPLAGALALTVTAGGCGAPQTGGPTLASSDAGGVGIGTGGGIGPSAPFVPVAASDAGAGSVGAPAGDAGRGGSSAATDGGASARDGGAYDIDLTQTSTSGISSGGFMAVQFHVAYSSIMKGAAIFAGGPFYCAQGSLVDAETQCMNNTTAPDVTTFLNVVAQYASAGTIDPTSHLAGQRVYLFGGADDQTVNPTTMDALQQFYAALVGSSDVQYVSRYPNAGHTMPTVDYGVPCSQTEAPYIGQCNYDGAGNALAQIYGTLAPAATSLSGSFVTLDQSAFLANPTSHSLATTGYAYVPVSCAAGEVCRIHVAFHGCLQESSGASGSDFYEHAGYNEWADTNHIIVLYPQTIVGTGTETNPNACWDWWGYDSPDYANRNGPQMQMVRAMIASFAGG